MTTSIMDAEEKYLRDGTFHDSELVIGLVGPVGVPLSRVTEELSNELRCCGYDPTVVQVSKEIIKSIVPIPAYDESSEYERVSAYMTAGDEVRRISGNDAALALGVVAAINSEREEIEGGRLACFNRQATIVQSLKHPKEVEALRRIYGSGFFLLASFADEEARIRNLMSRCMSEAQARELVQRDEDEQTSSGQRTRDTFHLADFFIHTDVAEDVRCERIRRIVQVMLGHPQLTPTFSEFAMFMAFASSLRSADLSRQVGAVIARADEILASGANDCPKSGGGLYWPEEDPETGRVVDHLRGRDYTRALDSNAREREAIIEDVCERLKGHVAEGEQDAVRKALEHSRIRDITEYGRVVHAEMEALLTCARNNISCRGATLYCTTFPCHNCAKHIIAAGIERVVYIEPYAKSKTKEFHDESSVFGLRQGGGEEDRISFQPFVGVGPRRFFDLFSMAFGSGYPLQRKSSDGSVLTWVPADGKLRTPMLPWTYIDREMKAARLFEECAQQLRQERQQEGCESG